MSRSSLSGRGVTSAMFLLALLAGAIVMLTSGWSAHPARAINPQTVFRPVKLSHPREIDASSHYCDGCKPPLRYHGGTVVGQGMTITPIYWAPPSGADPFPAGYAKVIDGYIANVAAASGATTNVYSVSTEYSGHRGHSQVPIQNRITAGQPLVDTDPLPPNGCSVSSDTTNGPLVSCVTDPQLVTELESFLTRMHLPGGTNNFYPVFFPPGVETTDGTPSNSVSGFCGYHSYTSTQPTILYSNEPFIEDCGGGQAPNGIPSADTAVDTLSHEVSETLTDPLVSAWSDRSGAEIGDICAEDYGEALGSTNPKDPQDTEYNQVINGGHYYTQTEFSNFAYRHFGAGYGCQHSEAGARTGSVQAGPPLSLQLQAVPAQLPADGSSTAKVTFAVTSGFSPAAGDRVIFTARTLSGAGTCGTVASGTGRTDRGGLAGTTYRASSSDMACEITATDAPTGKSVSAIVYQGGARAQAPVASARLPRSVRRGRSTTFTVSFRNPTAAPLSDAQAVIDTVAIGRPDASGLNELSVTYAFARGTFHGLSLAGGRTAQRGVIGGANGFVIPAHSTLSIRLRLTVHGSGHAGLTRFALRDELYQVNPATAAAAVLAATPSAHVQVR